MYKIAIAVSLSDQTDKTERELKLATEQSVDEWQTEIQKNHGFNKPDKPEILVNEVYVNNASESDDSSSYEKDICERCSCFLTCHSGECGCDYAALKSATKLTRAEFKKEIYKAMRSAIVVKNDNESELNNYFQLAATQINVFFSLHPGCESIMRNKLIECYNLGMTHADKYYYQFFGLYINDQEENTELTYLINDGEECELCLRMKEEENPPIMISVKNYGVLKVWCQECRDKCIILARELDQTNNLNIENAENESTDMIIDDEFYENAENTENESTDMITENTENELTDMIIDDEVYEDA